MSTKPELQCSQYKSLKHVKLLESIYPEQKETGVLTTVVQLLECRQTGSHKEPPNQKSCIVSEQFLKGSDVLIVTVWSRFSCFLQQPLSMASSDDTEGSLMPVDFIQLQQYMEGEFPVCVIHAIC